MDDYQSVAGVYDFFLEPFVRHIRWKCVRWVIQNRPKIILDLGCGTGKQLSFLPSDIPAIGIDVSMQMLKQSQTNVRNKCIRGDVIQLPFPDHKFDLVCSQFALHEKNMADVDKVLSEVRRILIDKGHFIVVDFAVPQNGRVQSFLVRKGIQLIEKQAGEGHYQNYKRWMENGGIDHVFHEAGWQKLEECSFYTGNVKLVVYNYAGV